MVECDVECTEEDQQREFDARAHRKICLLVSEERPLNKSIYFALSPYPSPALNKYMLSRIFSRLAYQK